MKSKKPILLVEDDKVDVMTVKRVLKDIHVTNTLLLAGNGEEALELLNNSSVEEPGIILLDLNMPRMNGLEFLKAVKTDSLHKSIPVVVLTTSRDDNDRLESFNHSVAGYMIKPVDYNQFVELMKNVDSYWTYSEVPE
ncbi:MAG: response regulator [Spirochaetota bacterium]|nr:response regulator [Spirochaetota bacterium]